MTGRFDNIHQGLSCDEARRIIALPVDQLESQSDLYMAAAHLINCPCPETEAALIELLESEEIAQSVVIAKRKSVEVLARLKARQAVTAIGKCLWSDDAYLVENSAWALQQLDCRQLDLIKRLQELLSDERQNKRVLIQALAHLEVVEAAGAIACFQDDSNPGVQGAAIAALAQLGHSRESLEVLAEHLFLPNQMDRQCAVQDLIDAKADAFVPEILRAPISPVFRLRALRQLRGADAPSSGQYLAEFDQVFEDNPDRLQLVHHYDAPPERTFLLNELFNTDFSRCYLALRSLSCCDADELWPLIEAVWQEKGWNDYGAHYFILHLFGLRSNWPATALATIEALLQEAIHNQRPQFRKSRPAAILSYSVLFPKQFLDHCQSWLSSTEMPMWECRYACWLALERIFNQLPPAERSQWFEVLSDQVDPEPLVQLRHQQFLQSRAA